MKTPTDKIIERLNDLGYRFREWGSGFILIRGGMVTRPDGSQFYASGYKALKEELKRGIGRYSHYKNYDQYLAWHELREAGRI